VLDGGGSGSGSGDGRVVRCQHFFPTQSEGYHLRGKFTFRLYGTRSWVC